MGISNFDYYRFYMRDSFVLPIRCLRLCARQIGIPDMRWVAFQMFDGLCFGGSIRYANRNPKIQGGCAFRRMLLSGVSRCLAHSSRRSTVADTLRM